MAETGRLTRKAQPANWPIGAVTMLRIALILAALVIWEVLARSGWLYRDVVPSLLAIGKAVFELLRHGYRFEQMQQELVAEQETNRHLRLETETLASPARIEREARRIGLGPATPADTVVVERVLQSAPLPKSVVASR